MIDVGEFLSGIKNAGINFITGVPDSLLKELCTSFQFELSSKEHVIAANEGSAVGLAVGHFLATGKPAMVYMQNSGIGNAINPLVSIADPLVASIPMILLIGWRGEILSTGLQLADEPQHVKQGQVTASLFDNLGIPVKVIDRETKNIAALFKESYKLSLNRSGPVAILVRKGALAKSRHVAMSVGHGNELPSREESIEKIIDCLENCTIPIVCTTGMASRELYEIRNRNDMPHDLDFLMVGGMGHASQVAAGLALSLPDKKVICIDGDGALLMHSGGLAITADCSNLIHILINNAAHDSVGGQPTKGEELIFSKIAKNFGYGIVETVDSLQGIHDFLMANLESDKSVFLEIKCRRGARPDLGRPLHSPIENKDAFMKAIRE